MSTIFDLKEQAVTDTPLLLFDCVLPGGQRESWSTHRVINGGTTYEARVLQHNVFEMQTASEQGVDGIPRISIVLANADSHFSEIERATGWKGAQLTVGFLFYDLPDATPASETRVLFQGICNPPDEIREATFRITATNRMNLQRVLMPQVRIQKRCPWNFPANAAQCTEAVDGGINGKYSLYYRCGYSAGIAGGSGNLNGSVPFTSCGFARADCEARGMFPDFGGIEYVPPTISVRTAGAKNWQTSAESVNAARYNDFVPMVYGTAWYAPPVVFARNDGNLTHMEVLLGIGEMQGVRTVLVSGVQIPPGVAGTNMTGTGWYNIPTLGTRAGTQNPDFVDGSGQPAGDPYGSMAYLSVVVPNVLSAGTTLPSIKVLVDGLKVPAYNADGSAAGEAFTSNPAWILLDILRRTGWSAEEIDIGTFAAAAAYCDEAINALDIYGNPITIPRFQCNLALKSQRSGGDLARGVRNCGRLLLTYGANGVVQVRVEDSIANQQPAKPAWSNSVDPLNGGWPSYEFGDGSNGFSGILRRASGEPCVRLYSRSLADTPNQIGVEFQDALNGYQQDSLSVVDPDDVALSGQVISVTLNAIGMPDYDQAARLLQLNLDKSIRGNTYIEFDTSVKSFGVRPGDIITITYLKEGFTRQPFRVLKIAPGTNHRVSTITAQIHDDAWYADSNGQPASAPGGGIQTGGGVGVPRPLVGSVTDANGQNQFGIMESSSLQSDGSVETSVSVSWVRPAASGAAGPGIPLVSLSSAVTAGGSLAGDQTLFYAFTARDAEGNESPLSFLVMATIVSDGSQVTLSGLSFAPGSAAFDVYRGTRSDNLFRMATAQPLSAQFTDTGLPQQLIAPPDANFDHASFYWRRELQPEFAAALNSANTVGNASLDMTPNAYGGAVARITRGRGAGQEQTIASNTATTLTVAPAWAMAPDATSFFTVAESGWRFGAVSQSGPAQFAIPNRSGETVHITGRAANVYDVECDPEISIVTRWQIGGAGTSDASAPPLPFFGLGPGKQSGTADLSGVSFTDLTNTRTITAATVTLYYWDELQGQPATTLQNALDAAGTEVDLNQAGSAQVGSFLQIDSEVMRVEAILNNGLGYRVTRGLHGSQAAAHTVPALVYPLAGRTEIAPFPQDFFGSVYSGSWTYPVTLPDVRVASAELFVTNQRGNSPVNAACFTGTTDKGLRTLSGGQYTIQVGGFLAVDQSAAPALIVDAAHSVRDVFAVLGTTADAQIQLQVNVNGAAYCTLSFDQGSLLAASVNGNGLAPLAAGSQITLSVLSVGHACPGADLTVIIRL
jgi:hypothetical protein